MNFGRTNEICNSHGLPPDYPKELAEDHGEYWYLPEPTPNFGCRGMIVRKRDGVGFPVGSGLSASAACWAFERGILDGRHDLIITECTSDLDEVVDILTKCPLTQRGMKIPNRGRERWYNLLAALPAVVFTDTPLWDYIHELMEAEEKGIFRFAVTTRSERIEQAMYVNRPFAPQSRTNSPQ